MDFISQLFSILLKVPVYGFAFVFVLTIIVFFHELGHFLAARSVGVKVDVFSIGFGKKIVSWVDKQGTEWRISWLPLGGYVKFFGDANAASAPSQQTRDEEHAEDAEKQGRPLTTQFPTPGEADEIRHTMTEEEKAVCFHFKPVWARAFVVAAGPFANFILATLIFAGLFMTLGDRTFPAVIASVDAGSPAEAAGLAPGDRIVRIDGKRIDDFNDVRQIIILSAGVELEVQVEREGALVALLATPGRGEITDAFGNVNMVGRLGFRIDSEQSAFQRYGLFAAIGRGADRVVTMIGSTLKYVKRLIFGDEDASQLGGPLRIVEYSGKAAESGFKADVDFLTSLQYSLIFLIELSAMLSVSIGLINLFPIPMLDGGHLMYYAYEAVAGRPLGERAQELGFRVGLVLVLSLMAFATWNDLNNLKIIEGLSGLFS
ncbi:MAG: RIP metalloprotease [Pseudomonadota bacterium]